MNRIQQAIDEMKKRLKVISLEKRNKLNNDLQEDFSSLVAYQQAQSEAFASGKLRLNEAQTLYRIYGCECPTPEGWAKQPLAARIVATQVAGELLGAKIAARRS